MIIINILKTVAIKRQRANNPSTVIRLSPVFMNVAINEANNNMHLSIIAGNSFILKVYGTDYLIESRDYKDECNDEEFEKELYDTMKNLYDLMGNVF